MKNILLVTYCLAVGIPLGLALWSKPQRNCIGDGSNADAKTDCASEADIVEAIEALAIALRVRGDATTADNLLNTLYGASTGTELRMGLHFVLKAVDRQTLQSDVRLLIKAEELLS